MKILNLTPFPFAPYAGRIGFPRHSMTLIVKGTFAAIKTRGLDEWIGEMADFAGGELGEHLRAHRADAVHPFLLATRADHVSPRSRTAGHGLRRRPAERGALRRLRRGR